MQQHVVTPIGVSLTRGFIKSAQVLFLCTVPLVQFKATNTKGGTCKPVFAAAISSQSPSIIFIIMSGAPSVKSFAFIKQMLDSVPDADTPHEFQLCAEFNKGRKSVLIGRHPTNDICLESTQIPLLLSRFHSFIEYQVVDGQPKYLLGDRRTTNGTYVRPPCIL